MNIPKKSFKVTILGSGTCVPSLERSSCSVLMEIDGVKLLFDSGVGTMRRLLEAGTAINDLSYIFLSHFHPDHSGELVPLLFATKYPKMIRKNKLTVVGGKGLGDFFRRLKGVYGDWIELGPETFRLLELDPTSGRTDHFDSFALQCSPVVHNPESTAYRITSHRGKSAVYSGDTDFSEDLIGLASDVDLLICEAALPDEFKVKGHLTPSLAGTIADKAGVGQLVLTHFYPECEQVDIKTQCRQTYGGPLTLARDLMQIELEPGGQA
jgi:ribonuclease BN (tRNA processing enzyme)